MPLKNSTITFNPLAFPLIDNLNQRHRKDTKSLYLDPANDSGNSALSVGGVTVCFGNHGCSLN